MPETCRNGPYSSSAQASPRRPHSVESPTRLGSLSARERVGAGRAFIKEDPDTRLARATRVSFQVNAGPSSTPVQTDIGMMLPAGFLEFNQPASPRQGRLPPAKRGVLPGPHAWGNLTLPKALEPASRHAAPAAAAPSLAPCPPLSPGRSTSPRVSLARSPAAKRATTPRDTPKTRAALGALPEATAAPARTAAPIAAPAQTAATTPTAAPATAAAPRAASISWQMAAKNKGFRQQQEAGKQAKTERLRAEYKKAKQAASECWAAKRYSECLEHLNVCIECNSKSDSLFRFRAKVHARMGSYEEALEDASIALSINPSAPANYILEAKYMHMLHRLSDAGSTLLQGLTGVAESDLAPGTSYAHLLDSVRRERDYFRKPMSQPSICFDKSASRATPTGKMSIFDPRKIFDTDGFNAKKPDRPRLALVERTETSVQVRWEEPYNGGDPIYKYALQMAAYEVRWDEKKKMLFDDYCDFVRVQECKYRTRELTVPNLQPDNEYKFRLAAINSIGESEWSVELETSTRPEEKVAEVRSNDLLPACWLRMDVAELIAEHEKQGHAALDFYRALALGLAPHVGAIRRVYGHYAAAPKGGDPSITSLIFTKFVKALGLIEGPSSADRPGKKLNGAAVDLLFQRANIRGLSSSPRRKSGAAVISVVARLEAMETVLTELHEQLDHTEEGDEEEDDENFAKSDGLMSIDEFAVALVRLAWHAYPSGNPEKANSAPKKLGALLAAAASGGGSNLLQERLSAFFELSFLPSCVAITDRQDSAKETLYTRRVRAIIDFYRPTLEKIYLVYARADLSDEDFDTVNLKELTFMMKEGNMFDSNFSVAKLIEIFAIVNQMSTADGEDDDETELDFEEFLQVLVRICDTKIPESSRGGGEFELTLQSWLHLIFIPTYMGLLKDKKRGVGKTSI